MRTKTAAQIRDELRTQQLNKSIPERRRVGSIEYVLAEDAQKEVSVLEETCRGLAKDLDQTIRVAAETFKEYQTELEQAQKEITELEQLKNNWKQHAEDEQHERILRDQRIEQLEDENAQFRETNYDNLYSIMFLEEDKTDLEVKVEAANKILAEFPYTSTVICGCGAVIESSSLTFNQMQSMKKLKNALLIPRKEGCKIGGLPQNVPTCPELKERKASQETST